MSGLPTAGEAVFVRLLYREDGLWLSSDVQYTAFKRPEPAPTRQNDTQDVSSAPDLSIWGLMAMVLGIWILVGIDARRRAARR